MSTDNKKTPAPADEGLANKLPEELLPVYEWYQAQGKQLIIFAAVLLVVVLGVIFYVRHRANQNDLASAALMTTESVEGMENLERQFGGTKVGPLIRLRLAEAYYNAGNYTAAREQYETFLKRHKSHPQADTARLGLAATQEALQEFAAAAKGFAAFADANPGHYLYPWLSWDRRAAWPPRTTRPRRVICSTG